MTVGERTALSTAKLTLILGGVRSGKSALAEQQAAARNQPVLYLATGQAGDGEMAERIRHHRARRPASWPTIEEPLRPAAALSTALSTAAGPPPVVLLDALDVWIANIILEQESADFAAVESLVLAELARLLAVCRQQTAAAILVSSEVGLSPVPPNDLGRRFQDLSGAVNQQAAAAADAVYLAVAGLPVQIKPPNYVANPPPGV